MKSHLIFLLYLASFALSCNKVNVNDTQFDGTNIPIKDSLYNFVNEILLSDIANNIEIISLETNKESVFGYIFGISVGENDLFINSYDKIYRFDLKNGKYINNIGILGNGSTDFYYCFGIGIDDKSKLIHVYSGANANNEMKTYSYEGRFVNSVHIAPFGAFMEGGFAKGDYHGSLFIKNRHFVRRMLPIQDGTEDIWQLGIFNTVGKKIQTFEDPANMKYKKEINKNRAVKRGFEVSEMAGFWYASSPVINQYFNDINILFDSNDTVYQYLDSCESLRPKYIFQCGERPDVNEIRKLDKKQSYFQYTFVTNILETKNYLYLVVEKNESSFLLCMDQKTGRITSIEKKGEIRELSLSKTYERKAPPPGFTNDLCGGIPFFPRFQNEKQWIVEYKADELLKQVDLEKLKKANVLFPDKRDHLVKIIENLKEDDNSIIMIVNLK